MMTRSLLSLRRCSHICVTVVCVVTLLLAVERFTHKMALTEVELRYIGDRVNGGHGRGVVVNPHEFAYIHNNERACADETNVFLVIYVHSAPGNFGRRELIRGTWGNRKFYSKAITTIFVLGKASVSDPDEDAALQRESSTHKDIVQEDFVDSYRNLTYKAIGAMKWISTYCLHAKYVLKSDDDIIVNPFTLMHYLEHRTDAAHTIMCKLWVLGNVKRDPERCRVTREEYAIDHYPPFCSGSAFIMTMDLAVALHDISYSVPFLWVDDVYLTGLLPFKLGNVTYKDTSSQYEVLEERNVFRTLAGSSWSSYVFGHVQSVDTFRAVWAAIVKYASQCRDNICLPLITDKTKQRLADEIISHSDY